MALINSPAGDKPATPAAKPVEKKDEASFKDKKNAAAKRHAEKVKAAKELDYQMALKARDALTKAGAFETLPKEAKDWILQHCVNPADRAVTTGFGGPSVFSLLFGDKPVVGTKVTLEEAFNKTYKGKSTLDVWVKRWAEKGIEVECVINPTKMLATTYELKKLPSA